MVDTEGLVAVSSGDITPRLCVNCKWYQESEDRVPFVLYHTPPKMNLCRVKQHVDLVTGSKAPGNAYDMRGNDAECGAAGKLWERHSDRPLL